MRNGRAPRRLFLEFCGLAAAALVAPGCQRPLVQQVEPLTLTARRPVERPQFVTVPTATPPLGDPIPERESLEPPARTAKVEPATTAAPARAGVNAAPADAKVELASLNVVEAAPKDRTEPAAATTPDAARPAEAAAPTPARPAETKNAAAAPVVLVPSSEAPPIAGPETRIVIDRPARKEPETRPEPPTPMERWRQSLQEALSVARDEAGKNEGPTEEWALRYAVLDWLREPGAPREGVNWGTVLAPLAHADGGSSADTSALAGELRQAIASLENLAPLEVTSIQLCRKVKGFGSYDPIEPTACKAGRAVIVYCELAGVQYEPDGLLFRSRVSSHVEVRPADGAAAVCDRELGVAEDSCRKRRRDYYVNYRLDLPDDLAPGAYELILTQTDLTTHQAARGSTKFAVAP